MDYYNNNANENQNYNAEATVQPLIASIFQMNGQRDNSTMKQEVYQNQMPQENREAFQGQMPMYQNMGQPYQTNQMGNQPTQVQAQMYQMPPQQGMMQNPQMQQQSIATNQQMYQNMQQQVVPNYQTVYSNQNTIMQNQQQPYHSMQQPVVTRKKNLLIMDKPKSLFSEAIKSIRTNLQFAGVDKEIKVILVTSPEPGDGKSSISSNLAGAYAQDNKKVLIIDCDLRKGRQAQIFNTNANVASGYTNMILNYKVGQDKFTMQNYILKTDIMNIDLIPNGPIPPNPIELLASDKNKELLKKLREMYDIIILDCPPVLGLSDTLIMTKYSDANIVVATKGKTKVELLAEVKRNFEKANATITGVVINKVKSKHNSYYGYYGE